MTVPGTSCRGGAISPDGRYLASPCTDLPGRIFQIDNGSVAAVLHGPAPSHATATLAAYSPQGDLVATTGTGGTIRFWASPSGRPGRVLSGQGSTVIGLAFSPDGRELGAASGAGAQLWRVTDGALIASLTDNGAGFESVAFSRDGRYFVTGGGDGAVRVWDASTGDPVETFRTHSLAVYRAVFSRQGNLIASASADRTARIDVCDLCESVPALVRLAKQHLPATG